MADDDKASKTEEPTPKKLEEAFEKGDIAKSQEIKSWVMLLTALALVAMVSPWLTTSLKNLLAAHLAGMHEISMDGEDLASTLTDLVKSVFAILSVPFGMALVAAFAGTLVQHKPVFTFEKMKIDITKLSPLKGAKKMFSSQSVVEFIKTILKFILVASAIIVVMWPERDVIIQLMSVTLDEVLNVIYSLVVKVLATVVSIMALIALFDLGFQKYQHHEKLRMTKQEVKDERKQIDGDPHIKAKIRQIRHERAQQRVADMVPKSNVVITNPTHFAVALKYEHGHMEVPVVMAKGVDYLAKTIRELAIKHQIPIVENPPLARALYATAEIDEEISADHYKAVAEIISFILKLKK